MAARHGTWTETGGGGDGWKILGGLAVVAVLLAVVSKALTAAGAAVAAIAEMIFWGGLAFVSLLVAAVGTWVLYRLHRGLPIRPARRELPVRPAPQLPAREQPALQDGGQGGLSLHLHGADAVREWADQMRKGH